MDERHTILTVPWVTEYLAMMDFLTLRLPYYISVFKILFQLYRKDNRSKKNWPYNILLVKFSLGWLFELPHFPDVEFFTYLNETDKLPINFSCSEKKETMLDDLKIVDQNILYTFCPFLDDIRKLLLTDIVNSNATVKHITPVTTIQSGEEIAKKKIEVSEDKAKFILI